MMTKQVDDEQGDDDRVGVTLTEQGYDDRERMTVTEWDGMTEHGAIPEQW